MPDVFYYVEKVAAYHHDNHGITQDLEVAICAAKRLARQDVDDTHQRGVQKFEWCNSQERCYSARVEAVVATVIPPGDE